MKQWIKTVLYSPQHTKLTDENILRLLLPSFVGILICMICLAGATWAWFSASATSAGNTIAAADYKISVDSIINDENGEIIEITADVNGGYTLEKDKIYTVKLAAFGTATKFGGYCVMQAGETKWHTVQLKPDDSLTFTLIPETDAIYTFTPVWGSYSGDADITDDCTIGQEPEITELETPEPPPQPADDGETVYAVQKGDTLLEIARKFEGMSVEEIVAYNDIENADEIQIGQEIKIPPADYEIAKEPVSETPSTVSPTEEVSVPTETPPESLPDDNTSSPMIIQGNVSSTDE